VKQSGAGNGDIEIRQQRLAQPMQRGCDSSEDADHVAIKDESVPAGEDFHRQWREQQHTYRNSDQQQLNPRRESTLEREPDCQWSAEQEASNAAEPK
jgi:hypothetical protein